MSWRAEIESKYTVVCIHCGHAQVQPNKRPNQKYLNRRCPVCGLNRHDKKPCTVLTVHERAFLSAALSKLRDDLKEAGTLKPLFPCIADERNVGIADWRDVAAAEDMITSILSKTVAGK